MEQAFSPNVWKLYVPAAQRTIGPDPVAINGALSQLSTSLLRLHPREYARWLAWNGKHAVRQHFTLLRRDHGVQLLLLALLMLHLVAWLRPRRAGASGSASTTDPRQRRLEAHLLFWVALAFAAAKTLLVILVEPAIDRYMMSAGVLLPSALTPFVVHYAERASTAASDASL
jgi:hypothetical protein